MTWWTWLLHWWERRKKSDWTMSKRWLNAQEYEAGKEYRL
jgi:hypothetical protein